MNHPLCRIPPLGYSPSPIQGVERELRPERSITRNSDLLLLHHAIASNSSLLLDKVTLNSLRKTSDRLHSLLDTCPFQKLNFTPLLWPTPEHIAFTVTAPQVFYRWCSTMKLIKKNELLDYIQCGRTAWLEFQRLPSR